MAHIFAGNNAVIEIRTIVIIACAVLLLPGVAHCAGTYDYGDAENWGGLCNSGKSQTPINIVTKQAVPDPKLCELRVDYRSDTLATVYNTGYSFDVVGKAPFGKFYLEDTYNLTAIHFHSPSEHTLNGKSFDLELHLVHKTVTKNGPQLAVIGLLYNQGSNDFCVDDPFLQQILDAAPSVPSTGDSIPLKKQLDFDRIVSVLNGPYVRYSGSLTTPPCTEGVTWTVILKENLLSPRQFQVYKSLFQAPTNRPLQELNGRIVRGYYRKH